MNKLNKLFEETINLIKWNSYENIKNKYKILDVRERFIYFSCLFVNNTKQYQISLFETESLPYGLRGNGNLRLPLYKKGIGQKTISFIGVKVFNQLSRKIREIGDPEEFKKQLKHEIINKKTIFKF